MTLAEAISIGVGGMIGAGVFSIMGVAGEIAGGATFLAFALAGALALLCAYSFGKLGVRYTSAGGPVDYLVEAFGKSWLSGGLSLTPWLGYVLALALYTRAFASYAVTFVPDTLAWLVGPVIMIAIAFAFVILNAIGAREVGRLELAIVGAKVVILLGFIGFAMTSVEFARIGPASWPAVTDIGFAAAVVFLILRGLRTRDEHGRCARETEDQSAPCPQDQRPDNDPYLCALCGRRAGLPVAGTASRVGRVRSGCGREALARASRLHDHGGDGAAVDGFGDQCDALRCRERQHCNR